MVWGLVDWRCRNFEKFYRLRGVGTVRLWKASVVLCTFVDLLLVSSKQIKKMRTLLKLVSNSKKEILICFAWLSMFFALYKIYFDVKSLKQNFEGIRTIPSTTTTTTPEMDKVLNISSNFCLSEIKLKINNQRGGWGDLTPIDLYRGAKETFDLGLREALPKKVPERVLDIGCGFALYDNVLLEHYGYPDRTHIYLLDKTTDEVKKEGFKVGGFRPEGISFYTNLECAKDILVANGASESNIHTMEVSDGVLNQLTTSSFDLVFSLLSYGHHYPVSTYLKDIKRILKKGGILILDLRAIDGTAQGLKELERASFECEIFRHRRRGKTVRCVKT